MSRAPRVDDAERRRSELRDVVARALAGVRVAKARIPAAAVAVVEALEAEAGPVESATRSDIEALSSEHPTAAALEAGAYSLAAALDAGAGLSTAAIARELRAYLVELARTGGDDDDLDLGSGGAAPG